MVIHINLWNILRRDPLSPRLGSWVVAPLFCVELQRLSPTLPVYNTYYYESIITCGMSYYALFVRDIKVRSGYLFPELFTKAIRTIKYVLFTISQGWDTCLLTIGLNINAGPGWNSCLFIIGLNIKPRESVVKKCFK